MKLSEEQLMKLYSDILRGDEDAIQFLLSLADPRRSFDESVRSEFPGEIWQRLSDQSEISAQLATQLHLLISEARYSLKWLRKNAHLNARATSTSLAQFDGFLAELQDEPHETPPSKVLFGELVDVIRSAVNGLPQTQQCVWRCYYDQKMRISQITEIERLREPRLTIEMVKSRLKRARKHVKSHLLAYGIKQAE